MSDFKKGDRVRFAPTGRLGTFDNYDTDPGYAWYSPDDIGQQYVRAASLELVEEDEPSFKVGDRVEYVDSSSDYYGEGTVDGRSVGFPGGVPVTWDDGSQSTEESDYVRLLKEPHKVRWYVPEHGGHKLVDGPETATNAGQVTVTLSTDPPLAEYVPGSRSAPFASNRTFPMQISGADKHLTDEQVELINNLLESPPEYSLQEAKGFEFYQKASEVYSEGQELLLKKHADYGPKNISRSPGGPLNGLRVRMWDKTARINNLLDNGAEPANESLRDSFIDLMNYSAIALMVIDGTWPDE